MPILCVFWEEKFKPLPYRLPDYGAAQRARPAGRQIGRGKGFSPKLSPPVGAAAASLQRVVYLESILFPPAGGG